jgi:transglutaminase-like putative cysteine protease
MNQSYVRPWCAYFALVAAFSTFHTPAAGSQGPHSAPPVAVRRGLAEDVSRLERVSRETRTMLQGGGGIESAAPLLRVLDRLLASDLLLAGAERLTEQRLVGAGATSTILARQAQAAAATRTRLDALKSAAAEVRKAAESADTAALRLAVDRLIEVLGERDAPTVDRTPLGVTLPYRALNLPAVAPQLGPEVVPAYLRPGASQPDAADLAAGPDVTLGRAIAERASALGHNPIAIFEYVQTQIAPEFYHGALKGAESTLAGKGGNDVDQASLLIALLRASAIPARYVRGVIRLTDAEAQSWTGVASARRAGEVLTRAGIPFTSVRQGGVIAAFQIEHTWVEAYVPYANYRGAPLDAIGRAWVPLDPSYKAWQVSAAQPIPSGLTFTGNALVASYLSAPQTLAPVDFYTKVLSDHLGQAAGGLGLTDVLFTRTLAPAAAGLLPSTLPYQTVSVNLESAVVPETLRHTARLLATGDSGTAFDVTVPVSELLGRRLTLSYVPATVEDQIAANAFLGIDNTPAYLLKLRPVLRMAGVIRGAGETAVQMGALHRLTIELRTPRTSVSIANDYVAGGYYAIGLGAADQFTYQPPAEAAPNDDEARAADLLYRRAADYLSRWNAAERAIGALSRVVPVSPIASHVVVGNVYNRTLLFGQPQAIEWRGVFVDADLRVSEPVPADADDARPADFRRMSALAGSDLEGRVLTDGFGVDAVSAARLIQLAREDGITVHTINASNVDATLPLLNTAAIVKTEIADGVRQGWTATVPASDFTRHAWNGIGYILSDPVSGAAGYFISGGLAGGMSSDDPADWVQQEYVRELGHPYQDPPNTDSTAAFSITKVAVSDHQDGTAGRPLPRPLSVWVRDAQGKPVQGATVTFRVLAGGGSFDNTQEKSVTTDSLGIASANPTLGRKTGDAPFFVRASTTDTYTTQVGENLVQARVTSTGGDIALTEPFQVFGFPGEPAHILKVLGDGNRAIVGTYGGTVRARLVDEFDNPISNSDLTFVVQTAVPNTGPLPDGALNLTIFPLGSCENRMPILGDCNARLDAVVETSVFGASVETIMGDTVDTVFKVAASAAGVPPVTFTLESAGTRDHGDPDYLGPSLTLTQMTLINDRGQVLNAAAVGTEFKRPLGAVVMLAEDHFQVVPNSGPCGPTLPERCFRIDTTQTMRVRPVDVQKPGAILYTDATGNTISAPKDQERGSVTFNVVSGGGTALPPVASLPADNPGRGQYLSRLTVGPEPAINRVLLNATAKLWAPRVDLDTGAVTPVLIDMEPGHRLDGFDRNGQPILSRPTVPVPALQDVFGVRARLLNAENVLLGADGGTTSDFDLEYRIEPSLYNAQLAEVDLFEKRPGGDAWLGVLPGTATAGDGNGRVHQGTGGFSPTKEYASQLVLNRGSEAEIRSPLQELGAYLTAPFGVDFRSRDNTAEHARKPKAVDLKDALLAEKATLKNMIASGLSAGAQCGVPAASIAILEQGSGACFWRPGFEADPTGMCAAFHPKVSDHDYEVLIPNAQMAGAACLVDALNTAGENADVGDVSFFVVSKEEFTTAKLNIDPPSGGGADVTGDLGLGRQSLLLKWALEGDYVTDVPGLPAPTPPLPVVLERLRTTPIVEGEPTGIPRSEGFEWATLQEYNFYKSRSHVRLTGKAVDPKSYLYELQQKEVHDAAKAGIRAAMGRLAAHVEGNKLLFVTRAQYQSGGGCLTGTENPSNPRPPAEMFPKVCDSFEEHIASAAVRSFRQGLGIFTENEVKLVYNFYRIKADAACAAANCTTQITSEAEANAFVENTRKFIQAVSGATKGVYDQILASGKDERAAQRLQNAERAELKRAEVARTAKRTVEDRVVNDSSGEFGVTPLDMYSDAAPGGAATPWTRYPVPRIQSRSETIVDVARDANGQPIRDGNGRTKKVFTPEVPAHQTKFVSFVLDPDNTVRECNKQDNFSGFFTYALDPSNPGAVPSLPAFPPNPVAFPAPPAECSAKPVPSIEVTKLVNGQPHIKVAPRTPVKITHRLKNTGLVPVEGVQVADLLVQKTYGPFSLAPGQEREVADTYVPTQQGKELVGPSEAIAFTTAGVTARAWDSVGIDVVAAPCPVAITELDPNPNPYAEGIPVSTVMEGGKAYRYYRVTGLSTSGGTVALEVNNRTIVASLDEQGNIVHTEGEETVPGLELKASDFGAPGAYPVKFLSVNGSSSVCSQPFFAEVAPREFSRGFTAGASIQAAASGGVGLAGKAGVGFGISIDERADLTRTKLSIDRSVNGGIGVQANATPGKAKVLLPGVSGQIGGSAEATLFGVLTVSDNHEFTYAANTTELPLAGSRALGSLILSTAAVASPQNPLLSAMLEAIADATDRQPYLAGEGISVGIEASGGASAGALIGLGATDKSRGMEFGDMAYGLGGGAGAGVNASALFGVDLKHKEFEVVPSFTLKASFDLSGFIGEGTVRHSVDETTRRDVLKLKNDVKASLRGTVGGSIKAKLTLDATRDYRPKKLSLAIATTKDWGWQVMDNRYNLGAGGDPDKVTYTYTLSDPTTIAKVLDHLLAIGELAAIRSATGGVGALLGPSQLSEEFEQLLIVLSSAEAEFDVATERGNGIVLPIGIELGAGARIEASAGVNFDRSIGFTLEKGVVKKGQLYTLERYVKDDLIPGVPDASDVQDLAHILATSAEGLVDATVAAVDVVSAAVTQGVNRIRSRRTAELAFDGATAPFANISIASFTYSPVAGPVADGLQRPADITGPADAPHFGIGGFHQFAPKDARLSAPGTLTFFYRDDEVANLSEATLAIYQWNAVTENWDHLGGTVDAAANTVTTTVRTLGLFTLAPPLPASRIGLSSQTSSAGSPQQPATAVAYTSGVIRMNTGLVVPDGTLFTVRVLLPSSAELLPFGTITTADADPLTDGVQVASQGGVIRFNALYPGAFGSVRVLVHAVRGVAVGDIVIPYQ